MSDNIVLSKGIVWTISVGLITAGIYFGLIIADLKTRVSNLEGLKTVLFTKVEATEVRVRTLEIIIPEIRTDLKYIRESLNDVKKRRGNNLVEI